MNLINKFYNEHRIAYSKIISIEKGKESVEVKTNKILELFNKELLPHFQQEEKELFTDDFGSKILMKEHNQVYALIEKMKSEKSDRYVSEFCSIMKSHINTEEEYFRLLGKKKNILPFFIVAFIFLFIGFMAHKSN